MVITNNKVIFILFIFSPVIAVMKKIVTTKKKIKHMFLRILLFLRW